MHGKSGVKNVIFIYIAGCFSAFRVGLKKLTFNKLSGQTWAMKIH